MGGGEGGTYSRGGTYVKLWPIGVALIRRGSLFKGALKFEDLQKSVYQPSEVAANLLQGSLECGTPCHSLHTETRTNQIMGQEH